MTPNELSAMRVDELVDRFAEIALAQDKAIEEVDNSRYRKLYAQMEAVDQELRSRGREARLALMRLYDYPNMQVRLQAATYTLGVAPGAARNLIQAIADSGWPPSSQTKVNSSRRGHTSAPTSTGRAAVGFLRPMRSTMSAAIMQSAPEIQNASV